MTWRSLGDSNPCFRRERVNTRTSANIRERYFCRFNRCLLPPRSPWYIMFAYRYSPKPPHWLGGAKWHARSATPTSKPAPPACDFAIRAEPYWRGLEKGFSLGYRRRASGGTWLARRRLADGGYAEHRISTTDDLQDADGIAVLDYGQAQKVARAWWRADLRREEGHDTRTGPFTVADAMADYLTAFERRGGKSVYATRRAAETHVLPALGATLVAKLTAKRSRTGTRV